MKQSPNGRQRCLSLAIWLSLVTWQLLLVRCVWDIAWHPTLGQQAFWSPPHVVLYSGVARWRAASTSGGKVAAVIRRARRRAA